MPRLDPEASSLERGHEPLQTHVKGVLGVAGAILVLLVLFLAALVLLLNWFGQRERQQDRPPSPLAGERQGPPSPRLQTAPIHDMEDYRRRQQHLLNTYGWVDRKQGVAREPVKQTLTRAARQGLPRPPSTENRP
jgi:hypothetical protein